MSVEILPRLWIERGSFSVVGPWFDFTAISIHLVDLEKRSRWDRKAIWVNRKDKRFWHLISFCGSEKRNCDQISKDLQIPSWPCVVVKAKLNVRLALGLFIWGQTNYAFSFAWIPTSSHSSISTLEIRQERTSLFYLRFEWTSAIRGFYLPFCHLGLRS